MADMTLTITGMFCGGCVNHVKDALRSVPGVEAVTVNLRDGLAQLEYDPARADISRLMGAVAAAGYDAAPLSGTDEAREASTLESMLVQSRLDLPLLGGVVGAVVLLAVYLGLISIAESFSHALQQLQQDAWFVAAVSLGFGTQVGLFVHLRTNIRRRASAALPAGSGGISTTAMVACCAHHLAEVLPFLGLSAAAVFLNEYRGWFMAGGLAMTALGIGVMVYTIHKVATGACAPAAAKPAI